MPDAAYMQQREGKSLRDRRAAKKKTMGVYNLKCRRFDYFNVLQQQKKSTRPGQKNKHDQNVTKLQSCKTSYFKYITLDCRKVHKTRGCVQ